jgi:hypothetical protein
MSLRMPTLAKMHVLTLRRTLVYDNYANLYAIMYRQEPIVRVPCVNVQRVISSQYRGVL